LTIPTLLWIIIFDLRLIKSSETNFLQCVFRCLWKTFADFFWFLYIVPNGLVYTLCYLLDILLNGLKSLLDPLLLIQPLFIYELLNVLANFEHEIILCDSICSDICLCDHWVREPLLSDWFETHRSTLVLLGFAWLWLYLPILIYIFEGLDIVVSFLKIHG